MNRFASKAYEMIRLRYSFTEKNIYHLVWESGHNLGVISFISANSYGMFNGEGLFNFKYNMIGFKGWFIGTTYPISVPIGIIYYSNKYVNDKKFTFFPNL